MFKRFTSKWPGRAGASGILASVAVAMSGLAACAPSEDVADGARGEGPSASVSWTAGDTSTQRLAVREWFLSGTLERSELFGLRRADEVDTYYVLTHMTTELGDDGSIRIDVDRPMKWSFEYHPGQAPRISGPLTPSIALALSSGLSDRAENGPPALATQSQALVPQGEPLIVDGSAPLLEHCPRIEDVVKARDKDDPSMAGKTDAEVAVAIGVALVKLYEDTLKKDPACNPEVPGYVIGQECTNKYWKRCDAEAFRTVFHAGKMAHMTKVLRESSVGGGGGGYGKCVLPDRLLQDPGTYFCETEDSCLRHSGQFVPYVDEATLLQWCVGAELFPTKVPTLSWR